MDDAKQHPLFLKYRRDWLHEVTGYSKGYLSRVAIGREPLSSAFVERVCYRLRKQESELFLPEHVVPRTSGGRRSQPPIAQKSRG